MSPSQSRDYHLRLSYPSIPIRLLQKAQMAGNWVAPWARPRNWPEELGQDWEVGEKIRRWSFCEYWSCLVYIYESIANVISLQWRIWFWQDDHSLTSPLFDPLFLFHSIINQAVSCRFRFRYTNHNKIPHYSDRFKSRPFLRIAVRRLLYNESNAYWR